MSNNSGGPWGGGGKSGGGGGGGPWGSGGGSGGGGGGNGGGRPPSGGQGPDLDEMVRKGQERLKVLMGGGGGRAGGGGGGGGIGKGGFGLIALALAGFWVFQSFYTVKPEEKSVELFLGEFYTMGEPGLNFAPWPVVRAEILPVTRENIIDIGSTGGRRADEGLMLTGDENIVNIDFQVVWNITDPSMYLFNLADPPETIRAVSESAMREVIARSNLSNILSRDRAVISSEVMSVIQTTLDSYNSGVNIVRLNFDRADPPSQVIDSFRDVQAAKQERDTLEKQADAYANQALAQARGRAAEVLQAAEGYRAQVVNLAQGEAARFISVLEEYLNAPEVTRRRLYLETMERVLRDIDKVIIDSAATGSQGVVPYLPLTELRRGGSN